MGACGFTNVGEGYNVKDVFQEIVEDTRREYGEDYYNGKISNSHLSYKAEMKFDKYNKTNEKKAYDYINKDIDKDEKNFAKYIDLGVVEYHLLTVKKKNVSSDKPVYKMKYVVKEDDRYRYEDIVIKSFDTKTDADKYAMEQALKSFKKYKVAKEYVLEKGNSNLTETYIEKKVYKSKPSIKDMNNKKLLEVHKYIFYGLASY